MPDHLPDLQKALADPAREKIKKAPFRGAFLFAVREGGTAVLPQSGPNFSLRPKAALLKQARPSAEYFAPRARDEGTHTPCGGRSAPPSLFYSPLRVAQWGPHDSIDSGRPTHGLPSSNADTRRRGAEAPWRLRRPRRCRLAVPEKNRRGSGCSLPHLKHERHPRHPHQAGRRFHRASGTEEYNPSAHFVGTSLYTREALAGHFTILCGGPGGVFHLPVGHSSSRPLALFSWTARRPVLFSAAKPPRPFWAAPQVRRLTQGARVSGDRSLSNSKGAPAALCAVGNKENGGPKALPLGEEKMRPFGRKEKFGRAARGILRPRPQREPPAFSAKSLC